MEGLIPKRLHRIWFGNKPVPTRYDDYWSHWRSLHPDWEMTTWTEENLPPIINSEVWTSIRHFGRSCGVPMSHERAVAVQWADLLSYELLFRYGGVYVNCDVKPLRSLEPLLEHQAFAGQEDSYHICNAVMGAEADSPFFGAVIAAIAARWPSLKDKGMEISTGPQLMTSVWREGSWPELKTFEPDMFYPMHFSQVSWGVDGIPEGFEDRARESGSYTIHAWGHRWQEGDMKS